jgi:hypothetical protein
VHLVDGAALGLGQHIPQLRIPAATIDQSATTKPDAAHIINIGGTEFWLWDLAGVNVAGPTGPNGQSELTLDDTPVGTDERPSNDAGWRSLAWVPNLRTLSGATTIVNRNALASSINLHHGRLESTKPSSTGQSAVWKFTHPDGRELLRRALTDRLVYTCPTGEPALRLTIGSQPVVFQRGSNVEATVRNLPPELPAGRRAPCPNPCTPNINHFAAFFKLVDAQHTPIGALHSFTPPANADVEPDYCPPARI